MHRSRLAEAALVGSLTALACFCAFNARAGETYSIVAQSDRSSAATGRLPIAERIAAANLPIIAPESAQTVARPREVAPRSAPAPEAESTENMAVAAVAVDDANAEIHGSAAQDAAKPAGVWPFGGSLSPRWPASMTKAVASITASVTPAKPAVATKGAREPTKNAGREDRTAARVGPAAPRQASTRPSGKGLSGSSPSSVTR